MRNFMNKIFKVIYSKTKHCYVVVSELAKSHCKTTESHRVRSKTALTAAVLLALVSFSPMMMPTAEALTVPDTWGGSQNSATGTKDAIVAGGYSNSATGSDAVVAGGYSNKAQGDTSMIAGGYANKTGAKDSVVAGGYENTALGEYTTVVGGRSNRAFGDESSTFGGFMGVAQGQYSTGVAGGSTGKDARFALAAGYGAVVTDDGVMKTVNSRNQTVYKNVATALGYQATADEAGTISFGHDGNDVSGYAVKWRDSNGNLSDYTDDYVNNKPEIVTTYYTDNGYYNRLVKIADGINGRDAVTMRQMAVANGDKANTTADNVGANYKVVKTDESGNTIYDATTGLPSLTDATDAQKKANESAWGKALGTGAVAKDNDQLVTGGTVYDAIQNIVPTTESIAGKANVSADNVGKNLKDKDGNTASDADQKANASAWGNAIGLGSVNADNYQLVTGGTVYNALQQQANDLKVNAGWGINVADEKDPKTGAVTKKNVISLNRNLLGTNTGNEKVTVKTSDTGLILGGFATNDTSLVGDPQETYGATGDDAVTVGGGDGLASGKGSVVTGGWRNSASGDQSTVVGGKYNKASGHYSIVSGGYTNEASGESSSVYGGLGNKAMGTNTAVLSGSTNTASGEYSVVGGGHLNTASSKNSSVWGGEYNKADDWGASVYGGLNNHASGLTGAVLGGHDNYTGGQSATAVGGHGNFALGGESTSIGGKDNATTGAYATALGGRSGLVSGEYSVGILGGSTGENAAYTLAAGYHSVVTDTGITSSSMTEEQYNEYQNKVLNNKPVSGIVVGDSKNGRSLLDKFATAVGYQATADEAQTISFGHDAGDVSGYKITWKDKVEGQFSKGSDANGDEQFVYGNGKEPTIEEIHYDTAYYNRLVKVADGIDDHDVVVMEQLDNAKNDLKVNAGWGINVADVTTKNDDGTETTTKNVISLNRNLGTNYGNPWKGKGKVTFEAGGENSLILGGAASILFHNEADDVKAGAYGKDSVLVGGFNNLITTNEDDIYKILTGQKSVIVGGYKNKATGDHSMISGGASNEATGAGSSVFGGQQNTASGLYASVFGGDQNKASEEWSSAIGGTTNTASGMHAVTLGGENNVAKGQKATTVGGTQNMSIGEWSLAAGGAENTSYGDAAYTAGGMHNMAYGNGSVALGGVKSNVNAKVSTGIAGGSTGEKAITALAAGYQSVVTDSGVEWHTATQADLDAIYQGLPWSGFTYTEDHDPYTTYVLDKISTAVGYQSTADAPGVIAFGHDKGDVASVAKKWKQKATEKDGKYYDANNKEISYEDYWKLANADGTWNDYTQAPVGTEEKTYQSAYYNRLVKAADGIDAHDAVVMEQLKPYTKSDATNVGSNLKTYTVGDDGETITEAEASDAAKTANENAWGAALGTGKVADPQATGAEKNGSQQLVTGGTVFNETRISAKDQKGQAKTYNYLDVNASAGKNLEALDSALKTVSTTAGAHTALTVEGGTPAGTQDEKTKQDVYSGKNILLHESTDATTGKVTYDLKLSNDIMIGNKGKDGVSITGPQGEAGKDGIDGKVGISGKDGKDAVSISGKDGVGHIGLTGPAGTNGMNGTDGQPGTSIDITVKNGYDGTAGTDGKDGVKGEKGVDGTSLTRIVYTDKTGEHQVATMEDGLKFKGDDGKEIAKKLNNTLEIIGGAKGDLTDGNIGVNSTKDGKLKVQLSKDLTGMNSTTYTTTTGEGESATTSTTVVNGNGMTITNGPSITKDGINGGGDKITNVGSGIEKDANGKYTVTDQNKGNAANIGDVQNMVNDAKKDLTDGANGLNNKANIDASNIGTNLKNADGSAASAEDQKSNAEKWGKAIGTGKIEKGNGQLVTGDTVYNEVRPKEDGNYVKKNQTTGENLSALDSKIGKLDESKTYNYIDSKESTSISDNLTKLDTQVKKNADDITNINNSISSLDQNAVKYDDSSKSKITLGGEGGTTITNVKDGDVSAESKDAVNGGQLYKEQQDRKDMKDLSDTGKDVIRDLAKDSVKVIAGTNTTVSEGTDGKAKTYTINVEGKGKVASGDTGLISGDTLYKEVHVDQDGSYIRSGNTVGQNLSALDSGLKTTSDLIHTNEKGDTIQIGGNSTATKIDVSGKDKDGNTTGRVITGVVTDGKDLSSAANVGYVNGITSANTQQIYRDMNNAYSRLDTNINRAAAGSNALAALHPLDFDPADKASFAVGYGHYHNANAAAIGAFYQPNANTMVNMGVSLGNGDPGFNAGVSFKLGKGSAYNGVSKAEMAQTIHDQAKEISAIKANDAAKDKRIDALEKENQEMKKQIQEILARLNG